MQQNRAVTSPSQPKRFRVRVQHRHSPECGCEVPDEARQSSHEPRAAGGGWTAALPALACLVCPACLSLYAKVLSAFGVGVVLSERTHGRILAVAVTLSLATSLWRATRLRRWTSFAITIVGAMLVVAGHMRESHPVEWIGVLLLLASGLAERKPLRALARRTATR
jgi:hypothetical protein